MNGSNGSTHPVRTPERLEEERALAGRVSEALWQAQVQQMQSSEWFHFASDGYLLTDVQGIIHEANYAAAVLLNARKEFLLGKPLGLFMQDRSRWGFYQRLSQVAECGGVERWEAWVCRPKGQPCEVSLTATAVPGPENQPVQLRWMLRDVTAVRQIERAWLDQKGLADCLLETAGILILLVDESGAIHRCNPFALMVSGYAFRELQGQRWTERLLPETERQVGRRLLKEASTDGSSDSGVMDFATRKGDRRRVMWSARKLGRMLLLIGHDVSELLQAQEHALRAERLAAIGQISTGLAHESRNALQRGQACVALLTLRLKGQPDCLELLGRIEKAQDDLQRLFEDVRVYASPRLQPQRCNLAECWREAWSALASHPQWPATELHEELDNADLFCEVDPFYLKQVFRNLLENSLAAANSPLRVVIRARPAMLEGTEAIRLRLRDNASGIPAEVRPHIFEPFFTTKVHGTGLGLAICRRIIEAHGGSIQAEEDCSPGTEMVITLPRRRT